MTKEEIKALRVKLGLTQTEFGLKIGVALNTVNGWEMGKHTPSKLALKALRQLKSETE